MRVLVIGANGQVEWELSRSLVTRYRIANAAAHKAVDKTRGRTRRRDQREAITFAN